MNEKDALGFVALGMVMRLLPALHPHWFPPTGADGTNAQAIWLAAMGTIEGLIGSAFLMKHVAIPTLGRWAQFRMRVRETVPAGLPEADGLR